MTNGRTTGAMDIMTQLREATRHRHAELEDLPFVRALIEHRLSVESYVNHLRALAIVHAVFEREISTCDEPRVQAVWSPDRAKLALLREDEAYFRPRDIADCAPSTDAALTLTAAIRCRRITEPASLLGTLYTLEGATLGNQVHTPDVRATFDLRGTAGCRYYASYGDQVHRRWREFSAAMNSAVNDPALHPGMVDAALEVFAGLETIYAVLFPWPGEQSTLHVTRINPEAGDHPIPSDPREIQAAIRAGDQGWAEFPYYAERYGERGKRFADSDTCWLATLCRLEAQALGRQIEWLRRVLAHRGMPSVMLEQTLYALHEELVRSLPENQAAYGKLRTAAEQLTAARMRRLPERAAEPLIEDFQRAAGPDLAGRHADMPRLLLSAVADEADAIEGAVPSLLAWATDPDRFPPPWIAAVNRLVNQAREMVR